VYGGLFAGGDPRSMAQLSAMFPALGGMAEKMNAESKKLQGTSLMSTTKIETVKNADQMKQAQQSQQQSGGGGISGALAKRIMGGRGNGATEPRSTIMTTTHEYLSVATSATADDVAIPQGFKEKKK